MFKWAGSINIDTTETENLFSTLKPVVKEQLRSHILYKITC